MDFCSILARQSLCQPFYQPPPPRFVIDSLIFSSTVWRAFMTTPFFFLASLAARARIALLSRAVERKERAWARLAEARWAPGSEALAAETRRSRSAQALCRAGAALLALAFLYSLAHFLTEAFDSAAPALIIAQRCLIWIPSATFCASLGFCALAALDESFALHTPQSRAAARQALEKTLPASRLQLEARTLLFACGGERARSARARRL